MAADRTGQRMVAAYHGHEAAGIVAERLVSDLGVPAGDVAVDRADDRAAVEGWTPVRPDAPRSAGTGQSLSADPVTEPGPEPERPGLAMAAWVSLPAGAVLGFLLLFLLGLVVPDGDQPRLTVAIIMGVIGAAAGGVIGALFGRARSDLVSAAGREQAPTSVISVPAEALGDEARLLEVLSRGPVDAIWKVDGPDAPPRRVSAPAAEGWRGE